MKDAVEFIEIIVNIGPLFEFISLSGRIRLYFRDPTVVVTLGIHRFKLFDQFIICINVVRRSIKAPS